MRVFLAVCCAIALSACSEVQDVLDENFADGPADFSFAGLTYSNNSDTFSGLPLTTLADMPSGAGANAIYRGDYTVENIDGRNGDGRASLDLDFVAATADLTLTGDVIGSVPGVITGTEVQSLPNGQSSFRGSFYNGASNGSVVAGEFIQVIQGNDADTFFGRFIVSR